MFVSLVFPILSYASPFVAVSAVAVSAVVWLGVAATQPRDTRAGEQHSRLLGGDGRKASPLPEGRFNEDRGLRGCESPQSSI